MVYKSFTDLWAFNNEYEYERLREFRDAIGPEDFAKHLTLAFNEYLVNLGFGDSLIGLTLDESSIPKVPSKRYQQPNVRETGLALMDDSYVSASEVLNRLASIEELLKTSQIQPGNSPSTAYRQDSYVEEAIKPKVIASEGNIIDVDIEIPKDEVIVKPKKKKKKGLNLNALADKMSGMQK